MSTFFLQGAAQQRLCQLAPGYALLSAVQGGQPLGVALDPVTRNNRLCMYGLRVTPDKLLHHPGTCRKSLSGTSKNQFRWLFEVPCGTCLLGEGL